MKYCLFPKFIKSLSLEQLMEYCASAGFDAPDAMVREGYWLEPKSLEQDLPCFIQAARSQGLKVCTATINENPGQLLEDDRPLKVLAQHGVPAVRIGYVGRGDHSGVRNLHGHVRNMLEKLADISSRIGIRVVVQLHGCFYPHNATAAWPLVKDLDPRYIGVMIDPGNNIVIEGTEMFEYQVPLLGEYIASVGAKDGGIVQQAPADGPKKGWQPKWMPAYEGGNNWHVIYRELLKTGFDGAMILMPFYDENNPPVLMDKCRKELAYFRQVEAQARMEAAT